MLIPSVSPSVGKGHIICIASSFPVATLGGSPEYHPLPSVSSEAKPSEESLTPPSSVEYGGLSQEEQGVSNPVNGLLLSQNDPVVLTTLENKDFI
ncbi:hypothetical protein L1987_78096 [Smallanthus sonchifolius]|uniref:Uncharacterized protein n=1 Tax=Smallanthus sonchifolius TaxID=185202 RepID=A0ACB8ZBY4_9ASTR|nr:hypothetical protein L1987_78096 [Smallanthus sonchifolius]